MLNDQPMSIHYNTDLEQESVSRGYQVAAISLGGRFGLSWQRNGRFQPHKLSAHTPVTAGTVHHIYYNRSHLKSGHLLCPSNRSNNLRFLL